MYAIHGKNAEIIHLIEDCNLKIDANTYLKFYEEAIKCHHNDIANYIENIILNDDNENIQLNNINYFKYYNFAFIQNEKINQSSFYDLCFYDYYSLVKILVSSNEVDINIKKEILNYILHSLYIFFCL